MSTSWDVSAEYEGPILMVCTEKSASIAPTIPSQPTLHIPSQEHYAYPQIPGVTIPIYHRREGNAINPSGLHQPSPLDLLRAIRFSADLLYNEFQSFNSFPTDTLQFMDIFHKIFMSHLTFHQEMTSGTAGLQYANEWTPPEASPADNPTADDAFYTSNSLSLNQWDEMENAIAEIAMSGSVLNPSASVTPPSAGHIQLSTLSMETDAFASHNAPSPDDLQFIVYGSHDIMPPIVPTESISRNMPSAKDGAITEDMEHILCAWDGCTERLASGDDKIIKRHLLNAHFPDMGDIWGSSSQQVRCRWLDCNSRVLPRNLARHISTKHLRQKMTVCDIPGCTVPLSRPDAWKRHKRLRHGVIT